MIPTSILLSLSQRLANFKTSAVDSIEARAGDYQGRLVSAARAGDALGWAPTTAFEAGMQCTVEWFVAKWARTAVAV